MRECYFTALLQLSELQASLQQPTELRSDEDRQPSIDGIGAFLTTLARAWSLGFFLDDL